jgi:hypothetical protein
MHQQLWGYKVEWKSVSRGTGEKRLNTTAQRNLFFVGRKCESKNGGDPQQPYRT